MWHASIAPHRLAVPDEALRRSAYAQLENVGDPTAGEWTEHGDRAFHLRRRLTAAEEQHVGPAIDVRGTWEATKRHAAVSRYLPANFPVGV